MSQAELARRVHVGRSAVSLILAGKRGCSRELLMRIAHELHLPLDAISGSKPTTIGSLGLEWREVRCWVAEHVDEHGERILVIRRAAQDEPSPVCAFLIEQSSKDKP